MSEGRMDSSFSMSLDSFQKLLGYNSDLLCTDYIDLAVTGIDTSSTRLVYATSLSANGKPIAVPMVWLSDLGVRLIATSQDLRESNEYLARYFVARRLRKALTN